MLHLLEQPPIHRQRSAPYPRMGRRKPLRTVEGIRARHETGHRERRCLHRIRGGETGVVGLAHRPELRFQAGGASGGDAESMGGPLRIQPQQPRASGGGTNASGSGGDVETMLVMPTPEPSADTDCRFGSDQGCIQGIGPADPVLF